MACHHASIRSTSTPGPPCWVNGSSARRLTRHGRPASEPPPPTRMAGGGGTDHGGGDCSRMRPAAACARQLVQPCPWTQSILRAYQEMHGRSRRRGLPGPYRTFRRPQSAGDQPGPHLGLGGTRRQQPRPVHRRSAGRRIGCASAASTGGGLRPQFGQDALFRSSVADLSRVLAVIERRLGHRIQRVVFGQSQAQIVVLGVQEGFRGTAGRDHRLPLQHRRMGKAIALDQSCCDVAWIRRWLRSSPNWPI